MRRDEMHTDEEVMARMEKALARIAELEAERSVLVEKVRGWAILNEENVIRKHAEKARADRLSAMLKEAEEAVTFARNRLEMIADESWNGDARDFKRSIPSVFAEFDALIARPLYEER
jgi:hypothetical protein